MKPVTNIRGYQLRERLGEGAFGTVYRAFQPSVQRDVAVKVIKPELANNPEFIRRFETEAQLVARLEHLHVVPLHDYWRDGDGAYLVMRLLSGGSLKEALERGPFSVAQTMKVLREIGGALETAHRAGIIHRDIKPANVLLDDVGNAYLSDFGIAKDLGADTDVTRSGRAPGSPAYMAPEQLQSEAPSPQTDIYALGLLAYEMLAGSHPFETDSLVRLIDEQLTAPLPRLEGTVDGVPVGIDAILSQATAKPPGQRFATVSEFVERLAAITGTTARPEAVVPLSAPNPYKGLRAFQESDAADFFGRGELVDRLVERLGEDRFLAVVGPSGSGKSSVVRAGVIPALRRGVIDGSESWLVADLIPGSRPFEELEAALLRVAINPPATLLEQLQRGEDGLRAAVKRILPPDTELVLVIDQFEEVFTLVDDATRDLFVAGLLGALEDERTPIRIIVTLRADFYDKPLQFEDLGELMRTRTETVLPLGRAGIEEAVIGPAGRVGVPVEPDLVPEIASDLADEPGALPLLQYALTRLFDARAGRALTVETYRDVGGVTGAVARRAEELYDGLRDPDREAARQVFLRLVTLGEGTSDTRRRVPLPQLEALGDVRGIVSTYGDARLLSFDRDPTTRTPTVEVAHEALLTEWERLKAWIDDSRDDLRTQRQLTAAAAEWLAADRDPSFLLTGSRLSHLSDWASTTTLIVGPDEQFFLGASDAAAHEAERAEAARAAEEAALEQRSRRRLRTLVAVMAVASVFGITLTIYALNQQQEAETQADIAQQQTQEAETQRNEAQRQADIAAAQTAEAETQAAEARRQQAIAEREATIAFTRELIAESAANQAADPALGLLLALAATDPERHIDGAPLPEAVSALWQAAQTITVAEPIASIETFDLTDPDTRAGQFGPPFPLSHTLGTFGFYMLGAFSGDGALMAMAQDGGIVQLVDTRSGRAMGALTVDGLRADVLAFSPDGSILAAAGSTIQVLDTTTMTLLPALQLALPATAITSLDFSVDGSQLLAATGTRAEVFDMAVTPTNGTVCCAGAIDFAFYVGDTGRIATASRQGFSFVVDGAVTIWDPITGVVVNTVGSPGDILYAVSTDGTKAAFASGTTYSIVDLTSGAVLHSLRLGDPEGPAANAGAVLYSSDLDGLVVTDFVGRQGAGGGLNARFTASAVAHRLVDAMTDRVLASIPAPNAPLPAYLPGLDRLVLSDALDGTVRVLNTRTGADVSRIPATFEDAILETGLWQYATSRRVPDGAFYVSESYLDPTGSVLVSCCPAATLWDLDARQGAATTSLRLGGILTGLAVAGDGSMLALSPNGAATLLPATDPKAGVILGDDIGAVAASRSRLATAGTQAVTIWSTAGRAIATLPDSARAGHIAWDADGTRLAAATGRRLRIWNVDDGTPPVEFTIFNQIDAIAFSADGSRLLTTGTGGVIEAWSVTDGTSQGSWFLGISQKAGYLAVNPDGRSIAAVLDSGTVQLIDATGATPTIEAAVHDLDGTAVAFSADGDLLATGSLDGTIAVLDADTLEERFRIAGYDPVVAVAFTADGASLIVGDAGGLINAFPVTLSGLITQARTLLDRDLTEAECLRYLREPCG